MKKIIVLLLLIAVVFSACSGRITESENAGTTGEETSAVFTAADLTDVESGESELATMSTAQAETAYQSTSQPQTETLSVAETTAAVTQTTENTTAAPTTQTTAKPVTTKPVTTIPTTTKPSTKPSTTKQVTAKPSTLPPETAAAQEKCAIILGVSSIRFGCTQEQIVAAFGSPGETVTETTSSGETVKSLVYTSDYRRLSVFQLRNGRLAAFYTVADDAIVTDGDSSYSLNAGGSKEFGELRITVYTEPDGKAYAFYARHGGFSYSPGSLESYNGQETLIFHITNALRAINGVAPLERSGKADGCIRLHCEDMAENNYMAHQSLDGRQPHERAEDAGIDYRSCGENLYGGNSLAFAIVDGWYNSKGHRMNLLDGGYEYIGIAMAYAGSEYTVYSGQLFYSD